MMKLINSKSIIFFVIAFMSNSICVFSQEDEETISASEDIVEYARVEPPAAYIDNYQYLMFCLAVFLVGYYFFKFSNYRAK